MPQIVKSDAGEAGPGEGGLEVLRDVPRVERTPRGRGEAEERSCGSEGRGLTAEELERVLHHYPGDVGPGRTP